MPEGAECPRAQNASERKGAEFQTARLCVGGDWRRLLAPFGIPRRSGFRAFAQFGISRCSGVRVVRDFAPFGISRC
jgi:hypothetical protein